jgi:hypothetical protein
VVLRSFGVAFVRGERVDHEGAPRAREVTRDPAEHQERAYDELGSHER